MAKLPAFQFYPADWLRDAELQMCSMSTQGIWINLLCYMWQQNERGKIRGTKQQFVRLVGCSESEFETFLAENEQHPFADISIEVCNRNETVCNANETLCNEIVTVVNRRMLKEDKERKSSYNRVLRHREKKRQGEIEICNANVTPPSSSSITYTYKEKEIYKEKEKEKEKEKIIFEWQSGSFKNITDNDMQSWSEAYPAVDVQLAIKQAAQWLVANPTKSKKNYRRFLTNWFARTQEKGGNKHAPKSDPNYRPRISEQDWGQELLLSGKNEMQMRKTTQGDHPDGTGLPGGAVCSVRRQTARSGGTTGIASDSEGEGRADAAGFGAGNTAAVCFRTPAGLEQNVQTNIARF